MLLETERLRLGRWYPGDWLAFRTLSTDPEVMRYINDGSPWSDEQTRGFIDNQMQGFARNGFCCWKLERKTDERVIGFCGLQPLRDTPDIEIGWWLARDCWGLGLASEAAQVAMHDGFRRIGLPRIVAIAQPENAASIHVMEKLGMTYESRQVRRGFDVVLYAKTR